MPETVNAPAQNLSEPSPDGTTPQVDTRTQARSVEYPEAPEHADAGCGSQLDILLDMDVPITVVLGATQIPVCRLLQLGPGSVLRLDKPIEAPADLYLKDSRFAEADVVVVEDRFAVRIRQIVGAGQQPGPSQA